MRTLRFIGNFTQRELKYPWHAGDRAAFPDLFMHEQRENKIVGVQVRFADEIAQCRGTPQTAWSLDQFSHGARLLIWGLRRKFATGRIRPLGGLDSVQRSMAAWR